MRTSLVSCILVAVTVPRMFAGDGKCPEGANKILLHQPKLYLIYIASGPEIISGMFPAFAEYFSELSDCGITLPATITKISEQDGTELETDDPNEIARNVITKTSDPVPGSDPDLLYVLIDRRKSLKPAACHDAVYLDSTPPAAAAKTYYAWVPMFPGNDDGLSAASRDRFNKSLAEEVVEAITDPEVGHQGILVGLGDVEIVDRCLGQDRHCLLKGIAMPTYYSLRQKECGCGPAGTPTDSNPEDMPPPL